jgi:hypothetical protein
MATFDTEFWVMVLFDVVALTLIVWFLRQRLRNKLAEVEQRQAARWSDTTAQEPTEGIESAEVGTEKVEH